MNLPRSPGSGPVPVAFRADDAGASDGITSGIVRAAREGVARNVSVMAPPPGLADTAARLRGLGPGVAIGLHVALNCEWSGLRWRALAKDSFRHGLADDAGFLRHRRPADLDEAGVTVDALVAEVRAQLAALRDARLDVVYLDEHMGVGWIRGGRLRAALLDLCKSEGLVHADLLPRCAQSAECFDSGIPSADLLARVAPGALFITHPAETTPEVLALVEEPGGRPGEVAEARARELDLLCSPRLRSACLPPGPLRSVTIPEAARAAGLIF